MTKNQIEEYLTENGKSPFRDWLEGLDISVKARIQARIFRFELGNFGDHKSVGRGVVEARLQFGSGYRIYFGRVDNRLIILLLGGDKGSQGRDIQRAQEYLENYLEELNHG